MEENTQEGVDSQESVEEQQSPEQEAQEAVAENKIDDGDITPEEQDVGSDAIESQQDSEDNTEKRINDLMSKWQSEEHQRKTLEEQNQELKQKLSKYKGDDNQSRKQKDDDSDLPPYYQEGWKPKSYEELAQAIKMAEERGHKKALSKLEERQQVQKQAQKQLDSFISEVKEHDDEFNENSFYDYANKHNFPVNSVKDLRSVYSAYYDNRQAIKKAEQRAKNNKEKRQGTGVGKPGAGKSSSKGVSMREIRGSGSILDMVKNRNN